MEKINNLYINVRDVKMWKKLFNIDSKKYGFSKEAKEIFEEQINKNSTELVCHLDTTDGEVLRDLVVEIINKLNKKNCIVLADSIYSHYSRFCICSIGDKFEVKQLRETYDLTFIENMKDWTNSIVKLSKNDIIFISEFKGKSTEFARKKLATMPKEKLDNNKFKIVKGELTKYKGEDEEIVIPGKVKVIGRKVFYECQKLKKVIIEEGVEEIQTGAFDGCRKLEEVVLPNSLKKIGHFAFSGCKKLNIKDLALPNLIEEIGAYAFEGCLERENIIKYSLDNKTLLHFSNKNEEIEFTIPNRSYKNCKLCIFRLQKIKKSRNTRYSKGNWIFCF